MPDVPGTLVSAIALSQGINANVILKWLPPGPAPLSRAPALLLVTIEPEVSPALTAPAPQPVELGIYGATLRPPGFATEDLRGILQMLCSLQ
jgi:hypothetical protein